MEILPGVHQVPSVRWSRAYLIVGETLTLVDSGLPWHPRGVLKYIHSIGRRPEEVERILITHGHPDHVGGRRQARPRHPRQDNRTPRRQPSVAQERPRPKLHRHRRTPFAPSLPLSRQARRASSRRRRLARPRRHPRHTHPRTHARERLLPARIHRNPLQRRHPVQRRTPASAAPSHSRATTAPDTYAHSNAYQK